MIYIVEEQILNGTVTMDILESGIEAESFQEAVLKFLKYMEDNNKEYKETVNIVENSKDCFSYNAKQKDDCIFKLHGRMKKDPLKILC